MSISYQDVFHLFQSFNDSLSFQDLLKTSTIDDVAQLLNLSLGQSMSDDYGMDVALFLAYASILPNQGGGPFGAVIVENHHLLAYGANHVTRYNDPTEHGEVNAIRQAILNKKPLNESTLITSCYPCPMCFGCAIEHNIPKIHFCSSPSDAQTHGGFLDQMLWEDLETRRSSEYDCPDAYIFDRHCIQPSDHHSGEPLITLLQRVCKMNGFEPSGLQFFSHHPISLPLFEFMSLCWAGVTLPKNVFIQPFNRDHVMFIQSKDHIPIGQKIFDLYRHNGTAYGQKK